MRHSLHGEREVQTGDNFKNFIPIAAADTYLGEMASAQEVHFRPARSIYAIAGALSGTMSGIINSSLKISGREFLSPKRSLLNVLVLSELQNASYEFASCLASGAPRQESSVISGSPDFFLWEKKFEREGPCICCLWHLGGPALANLDADFVSLADAAVILLDFSNNFEDPRRIRYWLDSLRGLYSRLLSSGGLLSPSKVAVFFTNSSKAPREAVEAVEWWIREEEISMYAVENLELENDILQTDFEEFVKQQVGMKV